jgi:hypothetical protein
VSVIGALLFDSKVDLLLRALECGQHLFHPLEPISFSLARAFDTIHSSSGVALLMYRDKGGLLESKSQR